MTILLDDFKAKVEVVVSSAAENFRLTRSMTALERGKMFWWGKTEGLAAMAHAACPNDGGEIDRIHRSALKRIHTAFEEA